VQQLMTRGYTKEQAMKVVHQATTKMRSLRQQQYQQVEHQQQQHQFQHIPLQQQPQIYQSNIPYNKPQLVYSQQYGSDFYTQQQGYAVSNMYQMHEESIAHYKQELYMTTLIH